MMKPFDNNNNNIDNNLNNNLNNNNNNINNGNNVKNDCLNSSNNRIKIAKTGSDNPLIEDFPVDVLQRNLSLDLSSLKLPLHNINNNINNNLNNNINNIDNNNNEMKVDRNKLWKKRIPFIGNQSISMQSMMTSSSSLPLNNDPIDEFGFYIKSSLEIGIDNQSNSSKVIEEDKNLIKFWTNWMREKHDQLLTSPPSPSSSSSSSPSSPSSSSSPYTSMTSLSSLSSSPTSSNSQLPISGSPTVSPRGSSVEYSSYYSWMMNDRSVTEMIMKDGIPQSIRGKVWRYLAASSKDQSLVDIYRLLFSSSISSPEGEEGRSIYRELLTTEIDEEDESLIKQDLSRALPTHYQFAELGGIGQRKLYNVLYAITAWNPEIGYCQGMSFLAAVLLLMCEEEDAFWLLNWMMNKNRSGNYYTSELEGLKDDSKKLEELIKKHYTLLASHLESQKIEVLFFSTQWFMVLFTNLPCWTTVFRIFDYYFIEGPAAIFRFSLSLLQSLQNSLFTLQKLDSLLPLLQNIPLDMAQSSSLLPIARSIPIHVFLLDLERTQNYLRSPSLPVLPLNNSLQKHSESSISAQNLLGMLWGSPRREGANNDSSPRREGANNDKSRSFTSMPVISREPAAARKTKVERKRSKKSNNTV